LLVGTKAFGVFLGARLVIAPQTIGPFKSNISAIAAAKILKRASIVFVRDRQSGDCAQSLGVSASVSTDVAFALPYEYRPAIAGSVGINVSGLMWNGGYSGKNEFGLLFDYKEFVVELVRQFLARGREIHLVSHVISDEMQVEDDYRASQQVKEMFAGESKVVVAPKFVSPMEAKSYISALEFFTGARMHATIAAISSGVPTVPFAYSRKFAGLFGGLDYEHTLNAYELNHEDLMMAMLDKFDHQMTLMRADVASANAKAETLNAAYVDKLAGLMAHA